MLSLTKQSKQIREVSVWEDCLFSIITTTGFNISICFWNEIRKGSRITILPEGYHFEFYKDGDRDAWIEIEKSAKEFVSFEQGLAAWDKYYLSREHELPGAHDFRRERDWRKRLQRQRHFTISTLEMTTLPAAALGFSKTQPARPRTFETVNLPYAGTPEGAGVYPHKNSYADDVLARMQNLSGFRFSARAAKRPAEPRRMAYYKMPHRSPLA